MNLGEIEANMFGAILGALISTMLTFYLNYKFNEYRMARQDARELYRVGHGAGQTFASTALTFMQVTTGHITYQTAVRGLTERGYLSSTYESELQALIGFEYPETKASLEKLRMASADLNEFGMHLALNDRSYFSDEKREELVKIKDLAIEAADEIEAHAQKVYPTNFLDYALPAFLDCR